MFQFDAERGMYISQKNDIIFSCENLSSDYEEKSNILAKKYYEKLPQIIDFMLPDLCDCYGDFCRELSYEEITVKLGKAEINLDLDHIVYCEHTFDYIHIFTVTFCNDLDEFRYFIIDG